MRNDQDLIDKVDELRYHLTQVDPIQFKDRKCARGLLLALFSFKEAEGERHESDTDKRGH